MLHFTNAQILNVFTEEFEKTELWIENNQIVLRGPSEQLVADETFDAHNQYIVPGMIDAHNQYIVPGMIDAHMHIESSLLRPAELGRLLAKHGVTSAVADPHELASVAGTAGLNYMLDDARKTPVRFFFMLPSSVPATPFERTGAVLDAASLAPFYDEPEVNGLAEVMDFPAVAQKQADMLQKIADANIHGKHADGHASGLSREQLAVYRQYGIKTDHEATSVQEAQERLDAGMSVLIRQGTVEADELALLPAVTPINQRAFSFATDDKSVHDLVQEGSIDENVQMAIKAGIRPEQAFTMASYHAALAEELDNIGALTDGYLADLVVLSDKDAVVPTQVMINGTWVDEDATVAPSADFRVPLDVSLTASDLALPIKADQPAHVIKIMPHHITTEHVEVPVPSQAGFFSPNATFSKIAVAERYHDLGHGVGIIEGLGIKQVAIGATVAHDSHNLILAGHDDESMALAAATLRDMDGGQVVVIDPDHIVTLPLPVGGLMSDQPYETVDTENQKLQAAFQQISDITFDPFLTLSFMALPVIPSLKITDQGLFDFNQFKFINLQD